MSSLGPSVECPSVWTGTAVRAIDNLPRGKFNIVKKGSRVIKNSKILVQRFTQKPSSSKILGWHIELPKRAYRTSIFNNGMSSSLAKPMTALLRAQRSSHFKFSFVVCEFKLICRVSSQRSVSSNSFMWVRTLHVSRLYFIKVFLVRTVEHPSD